MLEQSVPSRLDRLRAEFRTASRRSRSYIAALAPVGLAVALQLIGYRAAFIAAAAALAGAAFWRSTAARAAEQRREILDDLILNGWHNVAPDATAERERELLDPRNRKSLARAMENQVTVIPLALTLAQSAVTREVMRNRAAITRLAGRLRSREAVDPRGVVVVEHLIRDGGSPLHAGPSDQIAPALARAERLLDRAA